MTNAKRRKLKKELGKLIKKQDEGYTTTAEDGRIIKIVYKLTGDIETPMSKEEKDSLDFTKKRQYAAKNELNDKD